MEQVGVLFLFHSKSFRPGSYEKLVRFWTRGGKKMLVDILTFRSERLSSHFSIAFSGMLFLT